MFGPEDTEVVTIPVAENLPFIEPISDLNLTVCPWRIQLNDDRGCYARTQGSTSLRVSYLCSFPNEQVKDEARSTIGEVNKTDSVWTIEQVDGVDSVFEIPDRENPPTRTAQIVTAWING